MNKQLPIVFRILLVATAALILSVSLWLAGEIAPAEDAVILFRYAKHFAETGIISYNYHGPPVEGATDFLWMVLIALGHKTGLSPYTASLLLSLSGLIGMVFLIKTKLKPYLWGIFALLLAPQWWAAVQGFSVYFWGLALMGMMLAFYHQKSLSFALTSLLACLIRPDAVVLALPLALLYLFRFSRDRKNDLLILSLAGLLPALAYFVWRWQYFGEFFPLPFYVKGFREEATYFFHQESLRYWGIYLFRYLSPLLLPLILFFKKIPPKIRILFLVCLLCPTLFYSGIALEQNVAHRFAMPLLVGILTTFLLAWNYIRQPASWMMAFLLLSSVYSLAYFSRTLSLRHDQFPQIAQEMASLPGRMATTEAGRLPYYSGWESMDLWGLNDPSLSKRLVQKQDLLDFSPDLIVLDDGSWTICQMKDSLHLPYFQEKSWDHLVFNALKYAMESGEYEAFEVPYQAVPTTYSNIEKMLFKLSNNAYESRADIFLLKKDFAYYAEIAKILKNKKSIKWISCLGKKTDPQSFLPLEP